MKGLSCGAKWCTSCPNNWQEGAPCWESDRILDEAERYSMESQLALDVYDIMFPEDYLSILPEEEGGVAGEHSI